MSKKMVKCMVLITMVFCLLATLLCGCDKKENAVGKWYNSKGRCLDIRSDGTWKMERSYGTGKWKYLDDKKTIEFIDFYGDSQESELIEGEKGVYIDFGYYGNFYKNEYPSNSKRFDENVNYETEEESEKEEIALDAFTNLEYEVTGISPYCTVTLNNQKCSKEAQQYIEYKLDKEYYANGEDAEIIATLNESAGEQGYF